MPVYFKLIVMYTQAHKLCGPESQTCVTEQKVNDDACWVPCTGLYADISDDSLEQKTMEGEIKFFSRQKSLAYSLSQDSDH